MATDSVSNDSSLPSRSGGVPAAIGAVLKNAPAWAVSLLVHVIVLLSMALIVSPVKAVSTLKLKGEELPLLPAASLWLALIALPAPWPMVVRLAAVRV